MLETGGAIIGTDTTIKGRLRNGGKIEVKGYFEGEIEARHVLVHKGGRVFGTVKAQTAEVHGVMQGNVGVKALISIGSTGEVSGTVRYGQLALAEGGNLAAEVRNVPPELAGDLNVVVRKGRTARITTEDVTANDPDDKPQDLTFTIGQPTGGHVAMSSTPRSPISTFTQKDLEAGLVLFQHDGSSGKGSFQVVVTDRSGASSGAPMTVTVDVVG
jgi:cytoskeletal protein CcmA (bactofilin family)